MKRWLKIVWLCIALVFCAGLVICAAAFAGGARGVLYLDSSGLHSGLRPDGSIESTEPVRELGLEPFEHVNLGLAIADLAIVEAESYGYEIIHGDSSSYITVSNSNGSLSIGEEERLRFGIDLGPLVRNVSDKVTIYLPKGAELKTLIINTVSGSIEVAVDDMSVRELTVNTVSGNLQTNCDGLSAETLTLNGVSGRMDFAGSIERGLSIDLVSGSADISLQGNIDDYCLKLGSLGGEVDVNGIVLGDVARDGWPIRPKDTGQASSLGQIDVNLVSGKVSITIG